MRKTRLPGSTAPWGRSSLLTQLRRLLCLAAVPALALTGCGGSSPGAPQASSPPVKLVVSYSEIYEGSWPLWLTADAGLFRKHGLDVDLQYIASGTSINALVAG